MAFGISATTASLIGAGASLVGGVMSSNASSKAAKTQAGSADKATQAQLEMFNQTRDDQAPWREGGSTALSALLGGEGLGPQTPGGPESGYFTHQFDINDLNANLAPNYKFMLDQGIGAVTNSAASRGGLVGGNALKGINDYAQNYAQNAYQQAFNNYTANQTNIYNRLSNIAGLGQTAANNDSTGGSTYARGISDTQVGAGTARAAGLVGSANAWSTGLNNGAAWLNYGANGSPQQAPAPVENGVVTTVGG